MTSNEFQFNQSARRFALMSVSLLAICASGPALAQTSQATSATDAPREVETVVVTATPIRDSIAKSLIVQRAADNIVNVIAADTIGRFPDQTAAAALSRLPATGVQRDQGQERYIQVRGAPARWTNVAFDGVNVLGAEDRIFRFDSVPATVISQLELNKTLTPDMPGEALAGRVNIRTFSPLSTKGFQANADVGRGYVDLGKEAYNLGARVSWANDTFGVMLGASTFSFIQDTDNYEPRFDPITPTEANPGAMREVRFAKYRIKRETNALNAKFEWKLNEQNLLRFTALYSEFLDFEERNQYTFNFRNAANGLVAGSRTRTGGDLTAVPVAGLFENGDYATRNTLYILHGEHDIAKWSLSWDVGYAEGESVSNLPLTATSQSNQQLRPSLTFTAGEAGTPRSTLFETLVSPTGVLSRGTTPVSILNQTAFNTEVLALFRVLNTQTDSFAKGDVTREWSSFGADAKFKFGFQYNTRSFDDPGNWAVLRPNGTAGTLNIGTTAQQLGVNWTPYAFVTPESAIGNIDVGFQAFFINNVSLNEQLQAVIAAAERANATAGGNFPVPRRNPALANTVDEDVTSVYVQNTWKWDRHTLLGGLRIERSEVSARGVAQAGANLVPLVLKSEDTQYLPSLHYTYDFGDDVKLRAAFISGAARPSFTDQRATVSINDVVGIQSITGGNPELKPETAIGGDLSAEWYFAPGALLSASYFYRDVRNVLFDASEVVGNGRFNSNGIDRSNYTYNTTLNGGDGYLQGVEISYNHPFTFLPNAFSGLGIQASVAFLDGEFDIGNGRKSPFTGTSDRITQAAVFYEKYGFSLRLAWQHRTEWLDEISPGAAAGDLKWDGQQRVEFSGRYQLTDKVTLYADINNLTDERGLRYQGTLAQPYELEYFGRRFMFGVRARY
jgi:TonB-dependent receptor